jgi:hypothetical protein
VARPGEDSASRWQDGPPPPLQLGTVAVTGSYSGGKPVTKQLSETALTKDVELSSSFHLFFDRFLWPKTVTRQAVCLHPSNQPVNTIEECVAPAQPFTEPEYNTVKREVIYRLAPKARLNAATQYRLTVFTAESTDKSGFFAFDGAPLLRAYSFDFVTKASGATAVDELGPSPERYCAAQTCAKKCAADAKECKKPCTDDACKKACDATAATCKGTCGCLDGATCAGNGDLVEDVAPAVFSKCAFSPCHAASATQPAPMGLDFSRKSLIAATALGVTAHQTQTGEAATIADRSGNRFGRAMPLIDPSNPGNSYVMYKLLVNPQNFLPIWQQLDEIERLRAGAVPGIPMPGPTGAATPPTNQLGADAASSQAAMQLINDWIAHGAVLTCK